MADKEVTRPLRYDEAVDIARYYARLLDGVEEMSEAQIAHALIKLAADYAETGKVPQVTVAEIKQRIGKSRHTVQKGLHALEAKQMIRRRQIGGRPGEGSRQGDQIEPVLPVEEDEEESFKDRGTVADGRAGPEKIKPGATAHRLHPVRWGMVWCSRQDA